jgi:hypothetical protein
VLRRRAGAPRRREAAGIGFSHAYYGAIRHAVTVGFVSLMIADVARGQRPDPDGRPPEALPSPTRLRRLLDRRFEAFGQVEAEWERLSADEREAAPPPDDLLAGG